MYSSAALHPGGNMTSVSVVSLDLAGKRLGLAKELLPRAARFAVLMTRTPRRRLPRSNPLVKQLSIWALPSIDQRYDTHETSSRRRICRAPRGRLWRSDLGQVLEKRRCF